MPSISGLVSGLDTATIVNQLMQIEAISQNRLAQRVSTEQREVNSLQTLNAKLASIATRGEELRESKAWSPLSAESSSEHVTAAVGTDAVPGSLSFSVDRVAVAHKLSFADTAADTGTVVATPNTMLTVDRLDGSPAVQIAVGDGSLASVVEAVNKAGAGVQASAVRTDSGYRLSVTSTTTGTSSDFTLSGIDQLGATTTTAGIDARISIGTDTLSSASNTFTNVMTGLDLTVSDEAVGTTVDVTVERDAGSMSESVKSMVDAANAALKDIASLTSYDGSSGASGILAGDATLRSLRDQLLSVVSGGIGGQSLASVGIQLDRTGTLIFDAEKFETAYAADPLGTTARFTGESGFAGRLTEIADDASDATTGTISLAIKGRDSSIERMEDDIADWDVRLELRRSSLTRQYAALEVALGQLQNQSSWLAGQISGLPQMSNGQ